jgi:Amidase
MLGAIAGYDESDPTTTDAEVPDYSRALRMNASRLRVGVPRAPFFDGVDEEVAKSVDAAIRMLSKCVASIEDIVLPATPLSFDEIYARVRSIEAYAYHSHWIAESQEKYQAVTRHRILQNSAKVTPAGYVEARLQVDRLRREIKKTFAKVDLLVTPTMTAPPVLITQGDEPTAASPRNTSPFVDLSLEQQMDIPFIRFVLNRSATARYGLHTDDVAEAVETSFAGATVGRIFDRGARSISWSSSTRRPALISSVSAISPSTLLRAAPCQFGYWRMCAARRGRT